MKMLAGLVFLIPCLLYLTKDIKAEVPCLVPAEILFLGADIAPVPATYFLLYTRKNPFYPQTVTGCYNNSNFDPKLKVYLLLDGYNGSPNAEPIVYMKTAILHREDCNVIVVDWSKAASEIFIPNAIRNTLTIGKYVAEQLEILKKCRNLDFKNFHVIGFSLGGQTIGFIGKYTKTGKIGRITGLDIAGVCFAAFPPKYKLHYSDASFVDVIVTSTFSQLAMDQETGHVHFKPDGGYIGRGCSDDLEILLSCTHNRAPYLFGASFYSDCLPVAYTCTDDDAFKRGECFQCGPKGENCAALGYHAGEYANKVINGTRTMYLATTFTDDYCLFQYHVEVTLAPVANSPVEIGKLVLIINGHTKILNEDLYLQLTTENFQSGSTYTYLIVSAYNLDNIQQLAFLWYTKAPRIDNKLYVKCVRIVPMNNLQTDRSSLTTYGTTNGQPITPHNIVELIIGNKC